MFDLSKAKVSFDCPECKFKNKVTLGDVQKQKTIICKGCLKEIKLVDSGKSVKKSIKNVNKSIEDLANIFKK